MDIVFNLNVCRTCMKPKPGKCLLLNSHLREKYTFVTHMTLNPKDNLPTIICDLCAQRLNVSYDFIKLAKGSNTNLKAFINKVGQEFQQITQTNSPNAHHDAAENHFEEKITKIETTNKDEIVKIKEISIKSSPKKFIKNLRLKNGNKNKAKDIQLPKKELSKPLAKADTTISDTDSSTNNSHKSIKYFMRSSTSTVSSKAKYVVINDNSEDNNNAQNNIEKLQQKKIEEEPEEIVDVDSGTVYLQDYETLLEEGEYVYENIEEGQERRFLHGMILYDTVEHVLQKDPICDSIANANPTSDSIKQETVTQESAITQSEPSVMKPRRRRNVKPPTGTEARFFCSTCNRDFISRQNLNRHMRAHEGKKQFECKVCGKCFSQNGSLKQHSYTHTGERPYKCATCNRGFTQWKSLSFHMRRHTGEKPFPCEYCGIAFRQKDGLKAHLLKHHQARSESGNTEKHICSMCDKTLDTKKQLAEHMKRHLNKHKDVSGVVSTDNSQSASELLVEYLNEDEETIVEEDEVPGLGDILASAAHIIDVGGASAADPVRVKKYQCRTCFKCFAIMKNLIRHVSIHNSNLSQCTKCNLVFESNYALKLHRIQKHKESDIDLNECEECKLHFKNENELDDHLRDSHGLICPLCPELLFKTRNALLEHQVDHEDMLVT